jgi:uncharacterized repeat protein (TIGR03806 family)
VIGGLVYRGSQLPELVGAYIFADYVTGNVWALRWDGVGTSSAQLLLVHSGIAGFGVDPSDGELLIADHDGGKILRLAHATPSSDITLPATLMDTGAFADLPTLTPNPGIVPYDVNVPFWSDGAVKTRWFAVPDPALAIGFDPQQNWSFPSGTVWIKHFAVTNAVPEGNRRLETRLLVKTTNGVYGATYRWDDSNTNATLVPEQGLDEAIAVMDQGVVRTQVWHYPSRSECLACHTRLGGYALGFNSSQLNRDLDFGNGPTNQLEFLSAAGYFQTAVSNRYTLATLASLDDPSVSREYRVRSYLAANCSQCHQPGGSAYGQWDARIFTPTADAGIIGGLLYTIGNDPSNRVVTPGSLDRSMLYARISQMGKDHMPPIATEVLDTNAVNLVRDWITIDLAAAADFATWQIHYFGSTSSPQAAPDADPDQDGASNYLEYLVGSNPLDPTDAWKISIERQGPRLEISYPQIANRAFDVQWTEDLSAPNPWQSLDSIENQPFFSATNRLAVVHDDSSSSTDRFYRVSVRAP